MGLFVGTSLVLTEYGCMSFEELYALWNDSIEIFIIVNGKKHKCVQMERYGTTKVINVLLGNGMVVPVYPEQELLNTRGHYMSIASFIAPNRDKSNNYSIALNQINSFVWKNLRGTYDEGYIISLMTHNSHSYIKNGESMMCIQIRISNDILHHTHHYSYKMVTDYFKDKQFTFDVEKHMVCTEWTIYRFKSKYFKTLLCSINCRCVYDIKWFEKCSYDFIQGYLRGLFDMRAQINMVHDPLRCKIKITDKRKEYLQTIQRMLLNMGIPSRISSYKLIIKGTKDIMRFNFVIGFGVEDKSRVSCGNISICPRETNDSLYKHHHYWSYIEDAVQCRQQLELYKIEVEGEIIAVNGVLVKA